MASGGLRGGPAAFAGLVKRFLPTTSWSALLAFLFRADMLQERGWQWRLIRDQGI